MTTGFRFALLTLAAALLALPLIACDHSGPLDPAGSMSAAEIPAGFDPTAPAAAEQAAAGGGFYPLELGNSWHYARTDRFQLIQGGVPQPPDTFMGTVTEELTQLETRFGREYMVAERHIVIPDLGADSYEWIRYRQDKRGLYEAEMSITQPPAASWQQLFPAMPSAPPPPASLVSAVGEKRAAEVWPELWARYQSVRTSIFRSAPGAAAPPGGVLPDEVVRLDYPLHPGASWNILDAPLFTATVEAREMLELAGEKIGAWRTRLWNESMGPDDRVLIWYSRKGTLRYLFHFEAELTDPAGNPLGTYLFDTEEVLDGLDVAGPGGGPVAASARGMETAGGF